MPESSVEQEIRAAYADLSEQSGSTWVGLAKLRDRLGMFARADVDAALRRLSREPGVHVQAEANQQALTEADWQAGVTFGGSTRHLLKIERSGRF